MRLSDKESSLVLSDITFLNREEEAEDSSGDEDHADKMETEEGSSPARSRKRGRPPRKRGKASEASKKAKGKAVEPAPGGVQVKLNNIPLQGRERGEWEVQVPVGISVLELGEKSGMVWKVYLDRAAY